MNEKERERVVAAVVYEVANMGILVLGLRVYGPYLTDIMYSMKLVTFW